MNSKFLVFTCIFAIIFAACAFSCVNAATKVDGTATVVAPETVKKGDTFTVTVTLNPAVRSGDFYMDYDPAVLSLTSAPAGMPTGTTSTSKESKDGHKGWNYFGTEAVETLTYTFTVVGETAEPTTVTFSSVANQSVDAEGNKVNFASASDTVKVGETTDNPPAENPPAEDNKPADNKPTKYPQTGVNVAYVACGIALAVVAGYVVVKKH